MPPLATVYATDEDLARFVPHDFAVLQPRAQLVARGADGAFAAVAGGSWAMTSASVAFATRGVQAGMVAVLTKEPAASRPANWPASGEIVAVDSVSGSTVTFRRIGMESAQGMPPGPAAGVTAVTFELRTFYPQLEDASYDLNRKLGIVPGLDGSSPTDLEDLRDLRRACCLMVICKALPSAMHDQGDRWDTKRKEYAEQLRTEMDSLILRWKGNRGDSTPRLGARITR